MLNRAKNYYENESNQKINIETYLKKIKGKRGEFGKNRYHNMSEEKEQELKEYQKREYQKAKESQNNK